MKTIKVYHYDAFTNVPNEGNPAGVVFYGESLTEKQMQDIAKKVGFNETAFPYKSDRADLRIRFFTPGHEINLCGHATMATIYALKTKGLLDDITDLTIETKAGILPIHITSNDGLEITMRQATPLFEHFNGSIQDLAHAMSIEEDDIDESLPILYGSTGTWTLLIPIKSLEAFKRMKPVNESFPDILTEMPRASLHPFCLETYDVSADMHARHFSSPFSGTIEDPVTGTASGVMGAYYARYIENEPYKPFNLLIEQGQEINKNGRVHVFVHNDIVEITGKAVYVNELEISI